MTTDAERPSLGGSFSLSGKRVWVAGHRGMVGQALIRRLAREDCWLLTCGRDELDLRRQADVEDWMGRHQPDAIFLAAGTVGGILANSSYPADFIYDNLMIQANIVNAARIGRVQKLMVLGSSCIYPRQASQPIVEDALLTGALEATNEWYAVAKIAGIKLGQAYRQQYGCDIISAMPTNLYGPGDNFDLSSSHVLPALIRKAHTAKMKGDASLVIWGTGTPRRELLHVDDCADGCVFLMTHYSAAEHVNLGFGSDLSILELAQLVAQVVGFRGSITTDESKPDGVPRKLLDTRRIRSIGWAPKIGLTEGIKATYEVFVDSLCTAEPDA